MNLFPNFKRFEPTAKPAAKPAQAGPSPILTPADELTLAAIDRGPDSVPIAPDREKRPHDATDGPTLAEIPFEPTLDPTTSGETTPGSAPAIVWETGRNWLQCFAPVCRRCWSSMLAEQHYSDGTTDTRCPVCGTKATGESVAAEWERVKAERKAEEQKLSGRFAE
jgi:DNA-directed RNA polymerase subunit RPC12/RpoP